MTFEENIKPYLEHIPGSSGRSAGPEVRHEDFFEPEPPDRRCEHESVPTPPGSSADTSPDRPQSVDARTVAAGR